MYRWIRCRVPYGASRLLSGSMGGWWLGRDREGWQGDGDGSPQYYAPTSLLLTSPLLLSYPSLFFFVFFNSHLFLIFVFSLFILTFFRFVIYSYFFFIILFLQDGKLYGVYVVKDRWERPVLLFKVRTKSLNPPSLSFPFPCWTLTFSFPYLLIKFPPPFLFLFP